LISSLKALVIIRFMKEIREENIILNVGRLPYLFLESLRINKKPRKKTIAEGGQERVDYRLERDERSTPDHSSTRHQPKHFPKKSPQISIMPLNKSKLVINKKLIRRPIPKINHKICKSSQKDSKEPPKSISPHFSSKSPNNSPKNTPKLPKMPTRSSKLFLNE
jgi:hypothetical protein